MAQFYNPTISKSPADMAASIFLFLRGMGVADSAIYKIAREMCCLTGFDNSPISYSRACKPGMASIANDCFEKKEFYNEEL